MTINVFLTSTTIELRSPTDATVLQGYNLSDVRFRSETIDAVLNAIFYHIDLIDTNGQVAASFRLDYVQNQVRWTNTYQGAVNAVNDIEPIIGLPIPSGGGGSPGGLDGEVQFNDAGAFAGATDLTYDKVTGVTEATDLVASNTLDVGNELTLATAPGTSGDVLTSQGSGNPPIWTTPTTGTVTNVTATDPIASTGGPTPNISHNTSGVAAASYTNASVTVNATGHITSASSGAAPVTSVGATAPIASSGGATPTISINDTAVTPGSYTYTALTVDSKGRITAASSGAPPTGTVTNVTASSPLSSTGGTTPDISHNASGVSAATYGSATQSPVFAVNATGHVTSVTNTTITPAASSVTGGAALTKADDTNVTLTLGGTPASSLLAATSITVGWTGQLSVARGGTGLSSGTSGGILGYTASGTLASSAALTANAIVIGGGAGATPTTTTTAAGVLTALGIAPGTSGSFVVNGTQPIAIPMILPNSSTGNQWTNQPAALTFFLGQTRWSVPYDLTNFNQCNLMLTNIVAGAATSMIRILYRTQAAGYDATIGNWVQLGASAQIEASLAAAATASSGWLNIATLAKAPVLFAIAGINGDGVADPNPISAMLLVR